jgi:hypothetical protein
MVVCGDRLGKYVAVVTIFLFDVKCGGGGEILFIVWLDGGNCLSSGIRHVKSDMVMDRKH